jgi:NAD(P)-dependent dehydrogenase (short-subunit alcohol dehydrogenase family)
MNDINLDIGMKTVFITGISRGIGRGLALKFLKEGYFVIGTSITGNADFSDNNLKVFELDLYDDKKIEKCADEVKSFGKQIDIHINNAGVLLDEGEPNIVIDKLRRTLQVNLIGAIDITQRLLPIIREGGHIVNISSSAGSLANVHHSDYPAYKISKAALNMFTSHLAFKLRGKMKVSSVHPGRVRTDMGGGEGDMDITESAEYIFDTATRSDIETGQFWFKGNKFPW